MRRKLCKLCHKEHFLCTSDYECVGCLYPIAVWVRRGNQAASRSAAIKARDPTKWKSNCIVAVSAIRLCWCRKKLFLTSKPLNSTYLLHCPRALYLQKNVHKSIDLMQTRRRNLLNLNHLQRCVKVCCK